MPGTVLKSPLVVPPLPRDRAFSEPSAHNVAGVIDLLRELALPVIFGASFAPPSVTEQISREADVPIYMIDDYGLPGEPGGPEHAYINKRVKNIKTLAEALLAATARWWTTSTPAMCRTRSKSGQQQTRLDEGDLWRIWRFSVSPAR